MKFAESIKVFMGSNDNKYNKKIDNTLLVLRIT